MIHNANNQTGRVVIAGGSGFLGGALIPHFKQAGMDITVLTRGKPHRAEGGVEHVHWDGRTGGEWEPSVSGARAVINLAGKNINCRPTAANRQEIRRSRVDSVKALGDAVRRADAPPEVFVQASAVGYYGNRTETCHEQTAPGEGFLPETCVLWEKAFHEIDIPDTRRVILRIGMVLGMQGGALPVLTRLARAFLGGAAGNGRQVVSWVALDDFCDIVQAAVRNREWRGCFNATTPGPVTNAELMYTLRRHFHRPWSPPVPALAIRLGAWLMGTHADLVLGGQRAVPDRLLKAGFEFGQPSLEGAVAEACSGVCGALLPYRQEKS